MGLSHLKLSYNSSKYCANLQIRDLYLEIFLGGRELHEKGEQDLGFLGEELRSLLSACLIFPKHRTPSNPSIHDKCLTSLFPFLLLFSFPATTGVPELSSGCEKISANSQIFLPLSLQVSCSEEKGEGCLPYFSLVPDEVTDSFRLTCEESLVSIAYFVLNRY